MTFPLGGKANGACVTYNGVFNGNGHTIKGLVMDNKEKTSYSNAGLFCMLGNATVNDLVIDGSCSFAGNSAGALAVEVSGSVNLRGVTNRASVTGVSNAGGLIGLIQKTSQATLLLEGCVNYGSVSGTNGATQKRAGGMVGFVIDNKNLAINIYSSENYGALTGESTFCGGFIGYFYGNNVFTVEMSSCTNYGNVSGKDYASGFISVFWTNENGVVTMTKVVNYGKITGINKVGGVIGAVLGNKVMEMSIVKSTNAGFISGLDYVGGFVGSFSSQFSTSAKLTIQSCNNLGNVNANLHYSCGIFCHDPSGDNDLLRTQVLNTINKGTITGERACGISNNLTGAANVVSFGVVESSKTTYSLWSAIRLSTSTAYVLNTTCVNCGNAIQFGQNSFNGLYYQVGSSSVRMDDKLTTYAKGSRYDGVWTSKLEVVEKYFTVNIGVPVGLAVYVAPSSSLGSIDVLASYFSGKYVLVDSQNPSVEYNPDTVVTTDIGIDIVQQCDVTIGAPINTVVRIANGSLLGDIDILKPYFVSKNAIVDSHDKTIVFNKNTTVLQDMSVSIIHKILW